MVFLGMTSRMVGRKPSYFPLFFWIQTRNLWLVYRFGNAHASLADAYSRNGFVNRQLEHDHFFNKDSVNLPGNRHSNCNGYNLGRGQPLQWSFRWKQPFLFFYRGMGRSWPPFVIKNECYGHALERAADGTILDLKLSPEHSVISMILQLPTIYWTKRKQRSYRQAKYRVDTCWTCTHCDLNLKAEQPDGNLTSFHFLEY